MYTEKKYTLDQLKNTLNLYFKKVFSNYIYGQILNFDFIINQK